MLAEVRPLVIENIVQVEYSIGVTHILLETHELRHLHVEHVVKALVIVVTVIEWYVVATHLTCGCSIAHVRYSLD